MERQADVSRVERARARREGGLVGEGSMAFSVRSSCFAVVRREGMLEGGGEVRS